MDESPAGSPLSDLSSDAFEGEAERARHEAEAFMHPAKRQKTGESFRVTPAQHIDDDAGSISSDTSGDLPYTPTNLRTEDDDVHEQVTVCEWEGCNIGDLSNMDKLVEHIHQAHIDQSQKKFVCQWSDCNRMRQHNASAYALKSHMRSHTKEKPYFCEVPECDRSFTRSDALAKHMRMVHETEAPRPSDPVPKTLQAKASRLKLTMKPSSTPSEEPHFPNGSMNGFAPVGWTSSFPPELGFTPEDEARGSERLFKLLSKQVTWAEEEGESLRQQCEAMEQVRKKEWLEKEVLLDQVIRQDIDWHTRREEVLAGRAQLPTADQLKAAISALSPGVVASPAASSQPPAERDAAAALTSLQNAS